MDLRANGSAWGASHGAKHSVTTGASPEEERKAESFKRQEAPGKHLLFSPETLKTKCS